MAIILWQRVLGVEDMHAEMPRLIGLLCNMNSSTWKFRNNLFHPMARPWSMARCLIGLIRGLGLVSSNSFDRYMIMDVFMLTECKQRHAGVTGLVRQHIPLPSLSQNHH